MNGLLPQEFFIVLALPFRTQELLMNSPRGMLMILIILHSSIRDANDATFLRRNANDATFLRRMLMMLHSSGGC